MKFKIIPVTCLKQNCTLLWDELTLDAVIVDPGGESKKIIYEIEKLSLNILCILLTHGHIDHVGAALDLATYFSVLIYGPGKEDEFLIKNLSLQSKLFSINSFCDFIPNKWLNDGDIFFFSNFVLKTKYCPGHTPGHVIFINDFNKLVLVGDVIFNKSIGRSDLPGGDYKCLMNSIKSVILSLDDDYKIISGHGRMTTIGAERLHNPFLSS